MIQKSHPWYNLKANSLAIISILLGMLLFSLNEYLSNFGSAFQRIFAAIGLFLMFVAPLFLKISLVMPIKGWIKSVYFFFIIWILIILIRPAIEGMPYSQKTIQPYSTYGLFSYFLPLVVLLGGEYIPLKLLFKISTWFVITGFIFFLVNFNLFALFIEFASEFLPFSDMNTGKLGEILFNWFTVSFFLILIIEFITKKQKIIVIAGGVLLFVSLIFLARRGAIIILSLYILGAIKLYLEKSGRKRLFLKYLFVSIIIITAIMLFIENLDSIAPLLYQRGLVDTRNFVEVELIQYLNDKKAWIFGLGVDGTYPSRYFDLPRYEHETGYLHLVMKGGIIYLSLYIIILINSFYKGFYKTNNRFTKGIAIYLGVHVIYLYPFGVPSLSIEYLLLWIGVAICQSRKWRSYTNEQLKILTSA